MRGLWVGAVVPLMLAGFAAGAEKETCGSHGTSINFVDTPSLAAKQAKKEKKLVLVLHVSGLFEDPRFT
jgi:hypothetical protein